MAKLRPVTHKLFGLALAGVLAVAIVARSRPALAYSTSTCSVTDVGWDSNATTNGFLSVVCGGSNFFAWISGAPAGCGNVTMDTVKVWQSTAQSALLAGKNAAIYYTTSGTANCIFQLDVLK